MKEKLPGVQERGVEDPAPQLGLGGLPGRKQVQETQQKGRRPWCPGASARQPSQGEREDRCQDSDPAIWVIRSDCGPSVIWGFTRPQRSIHPSPWSSQLSLWLTLGWCCGDG